MTRPLVVLGIHPVSRGFGWALLDGTHEIHDWGTIGVKKQDKALALRKIERLVTRFSPDAIAVEAFGKSGKVRNERIRDLNKAILKLAKRRRLINKAVSRDELKDMFSAGPTRAAVATALAERLPGLFRVLPQKRKPWMSEARVMAAFSAAAVAFALAAKA